MKTDDIRKKFLDFFKDKQHTIVQSDSLVPAGDPTMLFTSAGMVQFKEQFMGNTTGFVRAATCQKCLRTGDLDNVGRTAYHHTFFEMLGNFSFGDYFKKEAIQWAWEFVVDELGISRDFLWVSVYEDDEQAFNIWKDKIKIDESKIVKLGAKSNYWPANAPEQGPNGPCGPCSEIFYDMGNEIGCGKANCSPACDCGRFVEVWNLVFTQFNRKGKNNLEPLPSQNIDTGMGLERIASVMQGVKTNFEIDIFQPIIRAIEGEINDRSSSKDNINSQRVKAIADHTRAAVFAISEGILPSNEERGYVIRKLIRRSIWYAASMGVKEPFLFRIVYNVVKVMGNAYPELEERREEVAQIIKFEEEKFLSTLESGERLALEMVKNKNNIAGEDAFKLYDTYGFPLELTIEIAQQQQVEVDVKGFDALMEKQRKLSQSKSSIESDIFAGIETDENLKKIKQEQQFVGYEQCKADTEILLSSKAQDSDLVEIVLKETPFYGESGGQIGDTGKIISKDFLLEVIDTINKNGLIICIAKVTKPGDLKGKVYTEVDTKRRQLIACNHTATHLLQAALRNVLGAHIKQSGSLVDEKKLRFDFTHFKAISAKELRKIEEHVNSSIKKDIPLTSKLMDLQQAKQSGALAFFGEKYNQKVRVVSISDISKELCAGTHLESTGVIGLFKIISESSIASGIRRIEAVTNVEARSLEQKQKQQLKELSKEFNCKVSQLPQKCSQLISEVKVLEKKIKNLQRKTTDTNIDTIKSQSEDINGISVIFKDLGLADKNSQQAFSDALKKNNVSSLVFTAAKGASGNYSFICSVSDDVVSRGLDASKILKDVLSTFGGSGGGRKDFAQGGIKKEADITLVLNKAKELVLGELS